MKQINDIYSLLCGKERKKIAVAAAADTEVLRAVAKTRKAGIINAMLFGNSKSIVDKLEIIGENPDDYEIFHCGNDLQAIEDATRAVSGETADILMKGHVQSSDFLRGVLNKEYGLRIQGNVLSSAAVFEIEMEGKKRLLFITDPGFVPQPDMDTKVMMIKNTTDCLKKLGYENPRFAVLSASEVVNPKMISSIEAKKLEEMNREGTISGCVVGGPFSMDLAISEKSAKHKGFEHPVAGKADVILVPSIEVGNAILKTILLLIGCPQAGFICGTKKPVVFTSRADSAETKANTIALAALMA